MGFMMVMLGLLAEIVVRTYHESQGKKTYRVLKEISRDATETAHAAANAQAATKAKTATFASG